MAENSEISWTTHTFNPYMGCSKVSEACRHCYAETLMDTRYGKVKWGPNGTRTKTAESNWKLPLKWNREAEKTGKRVRVFCASLADVFEDWQGPILNSDEVELWVANQEPDRYVPWRDPTDMLDVELENLQNGVYRPATMNDLRASLFRLIDRTPHLDWLLLTKRPENIRRMWPWIRPAILPDVDPGEYYRQNVWLGTSVENQEAAEKRIPSLLEMHSAVPVLFLSCEPLLGPLDLRQVRCVNGGLLDCLDGSFSYFHDEEHGSGIASCKTPRVNWVIVGGESGNEARPMHPDWAAKLRRQCEITRVPFHFKQWGEWAPTSGKQPILPLMDHGRNGCFDDKGNWHENEGQFSRYDNLIGQPMYRVGKQAAGRVLDGRTWDEFPSVEVTA